MLTMNYIKRWQQIKIEMYKRQIDGNISNWYSWDRWYYNVCKSNWKRGSRVKANIELKQKEEKLYDHNIKVYDIKTSPSMVDANENVTLGIMQFSYLQNIKMGVKGLERGCRSWTQQYKNWMVEWKEQKLSIRMVGTDIWWNKKG